MGLFKKQDPPQPQEPQQPSKVYAWSHLIRSVSKFLWVLVVLIVLAALGKMFLFKSAKDQPRREVVKPVVEKIDWGLVNKEIEKVVVAARKEVEVLAGKKLEVWIEKNMNRVDQNFLDWYFSYWTQQKLGLKSLLAQVWHWVDGDSPTAAEKMTEEVQEEFTLRVIRPQIAQMEMERIINTVVQRFSYLLKQKLDRIPETYKITEAEWDRYLNDVSTLIAQTEGNRSISVSLKVLVGTSVGGSLVLIKTLKPMVMKIGSKISTKLAAKSAAKMAAKTGGKVAAKAGGKFLGTIVAIGIIIWDVWDHHQTVKKARPVLRQNIHDYFKEMKHSLLHDPEFGIMTVLYQIEQGILKKIKP